MSGGVDADPEFATLREEIVRQGHTWVGRVRPGHRRRGRTGGGARRRARRRGRGQGPQGHRPGALRRRWSTPATPSPTTSSPRSPGRSARARRRSATLERVERGRGRRVAVGLRARDLHQRRAAADEGVRRVLRAQPRRVGSVPLPGRGGRPTSSSSIGGAPRRSSAPTPRCPIFDDADRERRRRRVRHRRRCASPTPTCSGCGRSRAPRTPTSTSSARRTAEVVDCGVPINDGPFHVVAKAALRHLVALGRGR